MVNNQLSMSNDKEKPRPMTRGEKRLIAFLVAVLIGLWMTFFVVTAWGFETQTPLGIRIIADDWVKQQYNYHWWSFESQVIGPVVFPFRSGIYKNYKRIGPRWKNIEWSRIDDFFRLLRQKYGVYPDPTQLIIRIMPIDYACIDESSFPYSYEFSGYGYACIDGVFPSANEIVIHLGDDPGQEWKYAWTKPFCGTALDWELFHYFLRWKGDPCWWDEFNPACQVKYQGVSELCQ
jgi:hypothetical protein